MLNFVHGMPVTGPETPPVSPSAWYLTAMERLVGVVQELSQARDTDAVVTIVRCAARDLTGADGATFVLRDGNQCYYAEENAIAPLWKGKRFPMEACISGWVMLNAKSAIIEDVYQDPRIPVAAYRPTFVKSLAMVPIRRNAPIGAIGNYWATPHVPTKEEIAVLQALADTTSVALENVELYERLQQQILALEKQQARISEQHEALEVFTRALSHDLKEPARALMSFSRVIQEEQNNPEKQQRYFQFIQNAADRMGMLIDAVFHYTQLDDPGRITKEPCVMKDILKGVTDNLVQLIHERNTIIRCDELPVVQANPVHMMQLLQSLITNAIRHNEGKVTLQIQAQEQLRHWLFSIHDDGIGVAPEYREKIFLPFKRLTHREGCAGLGLAVCRKIVASYGGTIWCESALGKGATFFFTLPKGEAMTGEVSAENNILANVLLVDDRKDDIELTRLALRRDKLKCNILIARDGEEAHGMLQNRKRLEDKIDLLLLDINMPGMDGFDLLERMQQDAALRNIATVMCTGSLYEKDRQRAESLGAIGYLIKPLSLERLMPVIKRAPALQLLQGDDAISLMRVA